MMTIYEHHDSVLLLLFSQGLLSSSHLSVKRVQYISSLIREEFIDPV